MDCSFYFFGVSLIIRNNSAIKGSGGFLYSQSIEVFEIDITESLIIENNLALDTGGIFIESKSDFFKI